MVYLPLSTSGSFPCGHCLEHYLCGTEGKQRQRELHGIAGYWSQRKLAFLLLQTEILLRGLHWFHYFWCYKEKKNTQCWWDSRSRQNHRAVRENSEALGCCAGKYLDLRKEIHLNTADRLRRKSGTLASFHCYLLLSKDLLCILSSSLVARQKPYF